MVEDEVDTGVLAMDLFEEIMTEAEKMSDAMSSFSQFGQLTYGSPRYVEFKDGSAIVVDKKRFFDLPARGKAVEMVIRVNVQEFNPDLGFNYERRIGVGSADWFKHWRKSVVDVFGLDTQVDAEIKGKAREAEINRLFKDAMASLATKYVEVADVAQEPKKKASAEDKIYRTPELRQVFNTREECVAAITERFGNAPAGVTGGELPTEPAPKGFASHAEFAETVKELRDNGLSNLEIAKELDVSVLSVTKVK